jgi:putative PIN family toxin of toxin-antitoxin system
MIFGGKPRIILEKIIRGELLLFISEPILSELAAVLQRPKFGFPAAIVNQFVTELNGISELIRPSQKIIEIRSDDADNRVLECAVEADAAYIISGDMHLLELKEYQSIQVMSPQQFLDMNAE